MIDVDLALLRPADAGEVLTLQRAAFASEAIAHGDPALPPLVQDVDDLIAEVVDPAVIGLGARTSSSRLVASVRARVEGPTAHLGRLVVVPDLQGRGLGTRMLAALDQHLPPEVTDLRIFTGEHNAAGLGLYGRLGFVEDRREPTGRGYDLVHLHRARRGGGDPFADVATRFAVDHYGDLRGRVRTAVVDAHLAGQLHGDETILDVGGGSAEQDVPLARRGHRVTVLDPSLAMLRLAKDRLAREPSAVRSRVSLVCGRGEGAEDLVGPDHFDVALCHGVLMYLDDPVPLLRSLVATVRPGGLVSIVATNRRALAVRPGLRGDGAEALALLDGERYRNGLGRNARPDDPDDLARLLESLGAEVLGWNGVRFFTDAGTAGPVDDPGRVIALEVAASSRDPYRQVSRLFHLLARRRS